MSQCKFRQDLSIIFHLKNVTMDLDMNIEKNNNENKLFDQFIENTNADTDKKLDDDDQIPELNDDQIPELDDDQIPEIIKNRENVKNMEILRAFIGPPNFKLFDMEQLYQNFGEIIKNRENTDDKEIVDDMEHVD
jgi:hypothetical protein